MLWSRRLWPFSKHSARADSCNFVTIVLAVRNYARVYLLLLGLHWKMQQEPGTDASIERTAGLRRETRGVVVIATAIQSVVRDDSLERNARERVSAHDDWADFITRNLGRRKIRTEREPGFQIGARVHLVDDFMVARFKTVAGRARLDREPDDIRSDGRDAYVVYLALEGEHELTQIHRSVRCQAHSM